MLQKDALVDLLKTEIIGRASGAVVEVWDEVDSTNARASQLARENAGEGTIVAARAQTAGRGRHGRTWVSPPDSGLYISFLLRPKMKISSWPLISLATGVAVANAIQRACAVSPGLKWVNDVVYGGKKLAGILAETVAEQNGVVVGIGINLRFPAEGVPEEIKDKFQALERCAGGTVDANRLAAELAFCLEDVYTQLQNDESDAILQQWRRKTVTLNKLIRATVGDTIIEGRAYDVRSDGALLVETTKHNFVPLQSGEITIRNLDGSYV